MNWGFAAAFLAGAIFAYIPHKFRKDTESIAIEGGLLCAIFIILALVGWNYGHE